jgi:hypothetical protein
MLKRTVAALALAFMLTSQAGALESGKWIILGTIFIHGEHEKFITLAYNEAGNPQPVAFASEELCNAFKNTNKAANQAFAKLTELANGHEDVFFDVHCTQVPVLGKDS